MSYCRIYLDLGSNLIIIENKDKLEKILVFLMGKLKVWKRECYLPYHLQSNQVRWRE